MNDKKPINTRQNIILEDREKLNISGVQHVDNFNDSTIVLATVKGSMTIKGEQLNMSKLNLEDGNVTIEGMVNSINYTNKDSSRDRGNGLLRKMFK